MNHNPQPNKINMMLTPMIPTISGSMSEGLFANGIPFIS